MNILKKLIAPMGLLSVLFALPAMAQIDHAVKFDAPSAFYAGDTQMPAGSYTVTQPDEGSPILLIEDADGSHAAFVEFTQGQSADPHAQTNVTFKKYGDAEFLDSIAIAGQRSEMQILPDRLEQDAAKATKGEQQAPSTDNVGQQ